MGLFGNAASIYSNPVLFPQRPWDTPPIAPMPDERDMAQSLPVFDSVPTYQPMSEPNRSPEQPSVRNAPRGLFGAPMMADMPAAAQLDPRAGLSNLQTPIDLANVKVRKPGWDEAGGLRDGLQNFAAALMAGGGNGDGARAIYAQMQQRDELARQAMQRQQDRAWAVADRDAKLYAPQYFNSGRDRVMFDPRSGQSRTVYDGPEDFQNYAASLGLQPGDDGYDTAVRDFVLRSNGPTAFGYRTDLEDQRQDNRVGLEGVRQGNRAALRGMPTYRDLHPAPARARAAAAPGGAPRTMAGVIAPLMAKVARGEQLSPAEQQAFDMYRSGRRGGGGGRGYPSGAGGTVSPGGGAPRVPGTRENPAVVTSADDVKYLPKGTYFKTSDGRLMRK